MSGKRSGTRAGEGEGPAWYQGGIAHVWLPYAQMKAARPPLPVVRTQGCRIVLADGRELVDGIASWWTACHGYNHPHIREAVERHHLAHPDRMVPLRVVRLHPALQVRERVRDVEVVLDRLAKSANSLVTYKIFMGLRRRWWRNFRRLGLCVCGHFAIAWVNATLMRAADHAVERQVILQRCHIDAAERLAGQ
jgi:hypothetical protein